MTRQTEDFWPITSFRDRHAFLSNFSPHPTFMDGEDYPSVEHAFQAAKTYDDQQRQQIRQARTPAQAKTLGRRATLRPDWEQVKYAIMLDLVRRKFKGDPDLQNRLLATGDRTLIEGNTWGDTIWGAVWNRKKARWEGNNLLGGILMKVRKELQDAHTAQEQ